VVAFSTVREVRPRLLKCGRIGSSAIDNSPRLQLSRNFA